jgi:coenzyme F420-dependent glucose-6-phosphate dehydrogenase
MGVVDSIRGVMWARRRQPEQMAYAAALASERFGPRELIEQAVAAEQAGFDAVVTSDHINPWWLPGAPSPTSCHNAWVWLGAAAEATSQVALGTGVTGLVGRYNPVVVAQQVATLEQLAPGRAFLGVGSSEAMNEIPCGIEWPPVGEQQRRTEEALTIITRLLDGERVDFQGDYFSAHGARLYGRLERRPPVYMSAFGPQAAEVAGRVADGIWTLADPTQAPAVIGAYRRAAEAAGREPGEIILQGLVSWAASDDEAFESAREWKATLVDDHYTAPIHDPGEIGRNGREVPDTKFKAMGILSSDPATHVKKIKAMQQMGATALVLMNVSGADPLGTLRTYGEHVLPELRQA